MTDTGNLGAQPDPRWAGTGGSLRPRNASTDLILALSFADSLDPEIYSRTAAAAAVAYANGYFSEPGAPVALTLNSLRAVCEQNTMTVGLSRQLSKRLKAGEVRWAGGKHSNRFGEVVDGQGRFAGKAREIENGARAVRTAAMVATVVVEAAHLIASADMARMQRETIDKLDRLEAYHAIAHEAELEQLYYRAREILAAPDGLDVQRDIREIRSKLLRLRITWRKEAARNLAQISDPRNSGWLGTVFAGQEYKDGQVIKAIVDEVPRLVLLDYVLRLDHALGLASNTWRESTSNIEAELVELTKLSALLTNKCSYVSEKRRDQVRQIADALASVPPYYEELLEKPVTVSLEPILSSIDMALLEAQNTERGSSHL